MQITYHATDCDVERIVVPIDNELWQSVMLLQTESWGTPFNPPALAPYHRYYCGDQGCRYCYYVGNMLYTYSDETSSSAIDYETFMERYGDDKDEPTPYAMLERSYGSSDGSSDGDSDSDEEEEEDDGVRLGYDPSEEDDIRESPFILTQINYDRLCVVGGGTYGCVLTDGTYAIKVGAISRDDMNRVRNAARVGLSVPVYFYAQDVPIDPRIVAAMESVPRYGEYVSAGYYLRDGDIADIAVIGKAEPFADHESDYDDSDHEDSMRERGMAIMLRLHSKLLGYTVGRYDVDGHMGNLGTYRGAYVILDF